MKHYTKLILTSLLAFVFLVPVASASPARGFFRGGFYGGFYGPDGGNHGDPSGHTFYEKKVDILRGKTLTLNPNAW